ncbi:MAG: hypothetical protein ACPG5W_01765, partial [Flavobacteriales bacterium]
MDSTNTSEKKAPVGVVGSGSFGSAISNLLAENQQVYLHTRNQELADSINTSRDNRGRKMHENIVATGDIAEVAANCSLIYPIVPSAYFRESMQLLGPHLTPEHILIHGTKGVDIQLPEGDTLT